VELTSYQSAVGRTFTLTYKDADGNAVTPVSSTYVIVDEDGAEIVSETILPLSGVSEDIVVTALSNTVPIDNVRAYRKISMSFSDAGGNDYVVSLQYVLEIPETFETGFNTFASFGRLFITLQDLPDLSAAVSATEVDLKGALMGAWNNIGNLTVDFGDPVSDIKSTYDLTEADINLMDVRAYNALLRAQVIEANAILGGNPVEDRRRLGMISDSSGESAQFFRTSKPLELPVSKQTMNALRGYVSWGIQISR